MVPVHASSALDGAKQPGHGFELVRNTSMPTGTSKGDIENARLTDGMEQSAPATQGSWQASQRSWRIMACAASLGLILLALILALSLTAFRPGKNQYFEISFQVIGDWGRDGRDNQSAVASAMGEAASDLDFVISVGDNFYEVGLTSAQDPQFKSSFMDVYTAPTLQVPWHAVLGNHDYGELWQEGEKSMPQPDNCPTTYRAADCSYGPLAQLDRRLTDRDWRWHLERSYTLSLANGQVEMFFIDTSPFVQEYQTAVWSVNEGGILEQSWKAQMEELEVRLARSKAKWKIVIGHHPLKSQLQEFPEVGMALRPILEEHGVQAYFCGHEHNLQYLHREGERTHHIVSGGGSQTGQYGNSTGQDLLLFHPGSGFVQCLLNPKRLRVDFMSINRADPILRTYIDVAQS